MDSIRTTDDGTAAMHGYIVESIWQRSFGSRLPSCAGQDAADGHQRDGPARSKGASSHPSVSRLPLFSRWWYQPPVKYPWRSSSFLLVQGPFPGRRCFWPEAGVHSVRQGPEISFDVSGAGVLDLVACCLAE